MSEEGTKIEVARDNSKLEERKARVKAWLKDPYNLAFLALMLFIVGIKLYHFSLTATQPTWWDEGDYLALSKEFALPSIQAPEWWQHFIAMRPLLMSFVWAVFIKFGISESVMRFLTEVFPSMLLVLFSYLFAKSMFNRKVGLIVGYMTGVYWVLEFYSQRFLTDIPAMLFAVASVYYFWEYYVKQNKNWGLYLSIVLGVAGFMTRFPTALVTFAIIAFLLFTKKLKFFTDKSVWIAGFVGVASLLPYFIYNKIVFGSFFPAAAFYGSENLTTYNEPAWILLGMLPGLIGWLALTFVIIGGAYVLLNLVLGYDIVWKQKDRNLNAMLLIIFWLALQIYYFVFSIKTGNDRWILLWMPPLFVFMALGLETIGDFLKKYMKWAGVLLIIVVLAFAGYSQVTQADSLIKNKLDSYKEVQDTGLWLKENTPENSKILCASVVQTTYYSHRQTFSFYTGTEIAVQMNDSVLDPQGRMISSTYQWLRNETELDCKIAKVKPGYLVVHVFEPEFTPQFMYDYPQRHPEMLEPLKVFSRQGQPMAVIYKFKSYPIINASMVNCSWVFDRPDSISGVPLKIRDPYMYKEYM